MNSIQEILAALGKGELNQEEANALLQRSGGGSCQAQAQAEGRLL